MPEARLRQPLPPGSTIGILGSGQLGRMLALAAARLGLKTHIYCEESGPAFDVATHTTKGGFDDLAALSRFAAEVGCCHLRVRERAGRHGAPPGRPRARAARRAGAGGGAGPAGREGVHRRARHRRRARSAAVDGAGDLRRRPLGARRPGHPEDAPPRLRRQGPGERDARRGCGCGVGADRRAAGGAREAQSPSSWRSRPWSCAARSARWPSTTARATRTRAASCAARWCRRACPRPISRAPATSPAAIAAALDYVGVLAVEMFYLGADAPEPERLMVNEIAPRVHNSGHWTIEACAREPVREPHAGGGRLAAGHRRRGIRDAEMTNLIGDEALDWQRLAAEPGACLHLYGKHEARAGRKMGHVTRLTPRSKAVG